MKKNIVIFSALCVSTGLISAKATRVRFVNDTDERLAFNISYKGTWGLSTQADGYLDRKYAKGTTVALEKGTAYQLEIYKIHDCKAQGEGKYMSSLNCQLSRTSPAQESDVLCLVKNIKHSGTYTITQANEKKGTWKVKMTYTPKGGTLQEVKCEKHKS